MTGGAGYIGSHVVYSLLESDIEKNIIVIDNLSNSNVINLQNIEKFLNKKIIFINCDLKDKSKLNEVFKNYDFDFVFHFAGLKSVSESVNYPEKYYYNNVLGSKNLFSLAKKFKIKNLIFSSSATVYGNPLFLPLNENHPLEAINPYGQNKIDIEHLLMNDHYFTDCCSVKILRYFNPIGAHLSGIIGENPIGIPNNLMP